ncbi:MAG: hypothetical protein ABIH86_02825, partial [Planctomycetota bacterium]
IISTHSPFFLLGLEKEFGKDGFDILNLPNGKRINIEQFAEFKDAFNSIISSRECRNWIDGLQKEGKPLLITEGATDAKIILTAWTKLYSPIDIPFEITGPLTDDQGGAKDLNRILRQCPFFPKSVVGIFDHDKTGCDQFKGIKDWPLDTTDNNLRKKPDLEHYALLLPIPDNRKTFRNKICGRDGDWHVEIEHYFSNDVLLKNNMVYEIDEAKNDNPFTINDNNKKVFSENIDKLSKEDFVTFNILFDKLKAIGFINSESTTGERTTIY